MKKSLYLLLLCLLTLQLSAQDTHFTQFYAAPLTLNPALAGAFDGTFRASAIYRDQWRGSLDRPFQTFGTALDMRYKVGRSLQYNDAVGIGILMFSDRVKEIDFNNTQLSVFGAYHKALDVNDRQILSIGFQAGFGQRNINFEDITFGDQFNGIDGYSNPTDEELPEGNISYGDVSVGLFYLLTTSDDFSFHIGGTIHHFNEPNISFYKSIGVEEKLFIRYSAQLGFTINSGERLKLLPRLLFSKQGPHMEGNAGLNARFAMSDFNASAIHIGSWVRPVAYDEDNFDLDAVVFLAGFEFQNILFGLSYDLNVNHIQNYRGGQNAFELSIAYLGAYENESVLCPVF